MDTISFRIEGSRFKVADWALFTPEFSIRKFNQLSLKERTRAKNPRVPYLRHFVLHPETDNDLTIPKVEVYENANTQTGEVKYELVVSGSLPKILNENNIEEILPSDRNKTAEVISSRLQGVGVGVSSWVILGASASVVHFCKNIVLPRDIALRSILSDLAHTDMGKSYDTTDDVRKKDKNNARVLHLFCGTREWTFYDKIEDYRLPKSRRTDKKRTVYEREIVSMRDFGGLEVLRYEYRLNKSQTIKSEINNLLGRPYETQVIFSDLFTEGLWQKVLMNSWRKVIKRPENQLALLGFDDPLQLMLHIFRKAKEADKSAHSQNKALWSCALALLIKFCGAKTVKEELNKVWANKDDRLSEKLETAAKFVRDLPVSQGITYITSQLEKFNKMTLEMLDNAV